jgi:AraC-like DNA-binding protein
MSEKESPLVWTTAPERRFRDQASPNTLWDAERMRDVFLRVGLTALASPDPNVLMLPPPKGFSPKRAGGRKDLHQHRYLEVGIVTRGEMALWWEGTTSRCAAGSVFVIPPGMRYLPHVETTGEQTRPHAVVWLALHRSCAVVHMCTLEGQVHQLSEYYCFTDAQMTAQASSIARELADRSPHYSTAVRGCLLCLLTWLLRAPAQPISQFEAPGRETKEPAQDEFNDRVESYLLSHYHRPLTLTQIARSIDCSPAYLCRHYRELTGQTPFQFLRAVRIEAAKRLLSSEVPIARVAEMVGFDDPLYFSKVFSGQTGESPQAYRTRDRGISAKKVHR